MAPAAHKFESRGPRDRGSRHGGRRARHQAGSRGAREEGQSQRHVRFRVPGPGQPRQEDRPRLLRRPRRRPRIDQGVVGQGSRGRGGPPALFEGHPPHQKPRERSRGRHAPRAAMLARGGTERDSPRRVRLCHARQQDQLHRRQDRAERRGELVPAQRLGRLPPAAQEHQRRRRAQDRGAVQDLRAAHTLARDHRDGLQGGGARRQARRSVRARSRRDGRGRRVRQGPRAVAVG